MGDEREAMIAKCYPNYSTTNTHTVYTQTHCKICHAAKYVTLYTLAHSIASSATTAAATAF